MNFDPRWIMDYWEKENQKEDQYANFAELLGSRDPEPYDYGANDTLKTLIPEPDTEDMKIPGEWDEGWKGLVKQGASLLPGVGPAIGIVSTIAGMIGRKKAEEEQEEQREKAEALRRAAFMSQNREQAVRRWM